MLNLCDILMYVMRHILLVLSKAHECETWKQALESVAYRIRDLRLVGGRGDIETHGSLPTEASCRNI